MEKVNSYLQSSKLYSSPLNYATCPCYHLSAGTLGTQTPRQICMTHAHLKFKTTRLILLFKITTGAYGKNNYLHYIL